MPSLAHDEYRPPDRSSAALTFPKLSQHYSVTTGIVAAQPIIGLHSAAERLPQATRLTKAFVLIVGC